MPSCKATYAIATHTMLITNSFFTHNHPCISHSPLSYSLHQSSIHPILLLHRSSIHLGYDLLKCRLKSCEELRCGQDVGSTRRESAGGVHRHDVRQCTGRGHTGHQEQGGLHAGREGFAGGAGGRQCAQPQRVRWAGRARLRRQRGP